MSLPILLAGAKAAGMIFSVVGQISSYMDRQKAIDIEREQIKMRMDQERLAFQQQSLADLKELESVLASQRVMAAARGVDPGQGSALSVAQESVRAFRNDEISRNLSQMFLKGQREKQLEMAGLKSKGERDKFGAGLFKTAYENVSFNEGGSLTLK